MTNWTMRQAMTCLIGSTASTLVLFLSGYAFWSRSHRARLQNPSHRITAIVQTGPEKEALKTVYLAELLGLSADRETNLFAFDLKQGEEKLLASPLIAKAKIKRWQPETLYIDYEVRKPIAWLGDYQNTAIDREGYIFPVAPFFSPKELPEIYLGLPPFGSGEDSMGRCGGMWQTPIQNRYFDLAFEILQFLSGSAWEEGLRIKRIDVSNAFAPSLGQREIVLFTEEELSVTRGGQTIHCIFPKILRLAPKEYPQQLANFFSLRKSMLEDYRRQVAQMSQSGRFSPRIVDLRIPQLAFIENHAG